MGVDIPPEEMGNDIPPGDMGADIPPGDMRLAPPGRPLTSLSERDTPSPREDIDEPVEAEGLLNGCEPPGPLDVGLPSG
jgi:hypothetical protein